MAIKKAEIKKLIKAGYQVYINVSRVAIDVRVYNPIKTLLPFLATDAEGNIMDYVGTLVNDADFHALFDVVVSKKTKEINIY